MGELEIKLALLTGPIDGDGSEAQLCRAWSVMGAQWTKRLAEYPRPGWRPWGHWRFELGEEMPAEYPDQLTRLAQLGELTPEEVEAARQRARGSLVGIERMSSMETRARLSLRRLPRPRRGERGARRMPQRGAGCSMLSDDLSKRLPRFTSGYRARLPCAACCAPKARPKCSSADSSRELDAAAQRAHPLANQPSAPCRKQPRFSSWW